MGQLLGSATTMFAPQPAMSCGQSLGSDPHRSAVMLVVEACEHPTKMSINGGPWHCAICHENVQPPAYEFRWTGPHTTTVPMTDNAEYVPHCDDYGHHGRERCVICGIPNPAHIDGDVSA